MSCPTEILVTVGRHDRRGQQRRPQPIVLGLDKNDLSGVPDDARERGTHLVRIDDDAAWDTNRDVYRVGTHVLALGPCDAGGGGSAMAGGGGGGSTPDKTIPFGNPELVGAGIGAGVLMRRLSSVCFQAKSLLTIAGVVPNPRTICRSLNFGPARSAASTSRLRESS